MLQMVFKPNTKILTAPFTANDNSSAKLFGFRYMTQMICPRMEDIHEEKR
jgi:hypothetical protein